MTTSLSVQQFGKILGDWYTGNGRDLPWRQTYDPYAIWVSEIMLQQTQVERVKGFYTRFLKRFPKIQDLAAANWEEVLEYWRGLGYYRRARNLHKTAQIVVENFGGKFPRTYESLKKLPGIGSYTAAAISSFAFGEKVPALDTNLARVFERVFGKKWTGLGLREKFLFAQQYMGNLNGRDFNYGLMDVGAMICSSRQPKCGECCFGKVCAFARTGTRAGTGPYIRSDIYVRTGARVREHERMGVQARVSPQDRAGTRESRLGNQPKVLKNFVDKFSDASQGLAFADAELLDRKRGSKLKPNPGAIKVAAGVLIHNGKILISKRPKGKPLAGLWEFPGGKLEFKEDERQCLKREFMEELAIEVSVRPAFYKTVTEHDGLEIRLSFHRCSLLLGDVKSLEGQQFRWVNVDELRNFEFPSANTEVIDILRAKKAMFWV